MVGFDTVYVERLVVYRQKAFAKCRCRPDFFRDADHRLFAVSGKCRHGLPAANADTGFSLYFYINDSKEYDDLKEKNHSPIQLIGQMKGYFFETVMELIKSKLSGHIEQNLFATMSDDDVEPTHATILMDATQILKAAIDTIYHDATSS